MNSLVMTECAATGFSVYQCPTPNAQEKVAALCQSVSCVAVQYPEAGYGSEF